MKSITIRVEGEAYEFQVVEEDTSGDVALECVSDQKIVPAAIWHDAFELAINPEMMQ